jgi:hypothetical protein
MGTRSLLFLVLLVSCDSLPAAQNGVCGNKVIDPAEDCDTFGAGPGTLCRPPGTVGQCRYGCGPQPDGTSAVCPAGMGCGTDGTCRAPDGTFVDAKQTIEGHFTDVYVGDVDGDGRADVVGTQLGVLSTSFFDATLTSVVHVSTPSRQNSLVHPILGDLDGDGRADLVVGAGDGTIVDLGSSSRAFVPTAFPSSEVPNLTNASVIVVNTLPGYGGGQTIFILGTYTSFSGIALLEPTGQGVAFTLLDRPPSDLAGPVAVGHMIEDPAVSPCDELAFGHKGDTYVDVYTACGPDGMGGFAWNAYDGKTKKPTEVSLTGGATLVSGPLLLDANGDGHLDFLVGASRCSGCDEVDVAYGVGDGTFHSDPSTIPAQNGDEQFSTYPLVKGPLPLAMGDLNGDGVLDYVTPTDVDVSEGGGATFSKKALNHAADWTEAVIADFDRDGIPDVAAGSSDAPNLSFYIGAGGGALDPFVVPSAPVAHLTVGDFDGDLVNDLAVSEIAPANDPLGDSVSIAFGNAAGAPSAPISMGRFTSIRQAVAGKFADSFGVLSGTDALFTTSMPNDTTTDFGTFAGAGDRVLRSPLAMTFVSTTQAFSSAFPLRYAFGHFTSATGPIDVAALDDQIFPKPPPAVRRLWTLPTDGYGRFTDPTVRESDPVPDGLDWEHVAIAAVDLDGSGTDQLVALGPSAADPTQGAFAVARMTPGSGTDTQPRLVFDAPSPIAPVVSHVEMQGVGEQSGRLLVRDLDGDGRPDVVAVATVAGAPSVVVFWNDLGGTLGATTTVPNPNGHPVVDFTMLDAGGAGPTIAVLTDEGVTLASFAQRTPTVQGSLAFPVSGGHLIATGDIDGDGVADLVVDADAGLVIYRGHPVRP